jgi:ATP-dependent RNA helicase DHX36
MRSNPDLEGYSHVILDEIHERDILSDFLITILKDVLKKRKDLKVILMSATLNAELFSKYYGGSPMIKIPGFTFPVEEFYLEDVLEKTGFRISGRAPRGNEQKWHKHTKRGREAAAVVNDFDGFIAPYIRDMRARGNYSEQTLESLSYSESEDINHELIATLVHHIHTTQGDGAILVFLPGWDDISKLNKLLTEDRNYSLTGGNVQIFPLHSLMPTMSQKAIFTRPPRGTRKIVIATNIAETSITIDDVVFVVDCGKIKMSNFDVKNNISTLKPEWVSLANARQRRGRAGRVQAGVCYHLYSKAREMTLEQFVVPEMLRTKLEEVVLQIKILEFGRASSFLSRVMEPPDDRAVELAIEMLVNIHALDTEEQLTPLGFHLAQLPMDPQTGKMILLGAIFGCLDPVLSVAASLSFKDAFVVPLGKEEVVDKKKRELSSGTRSDHLMLANAILDWEAAVSRGDARQFCWENFLSESTLKMLDNMKRQFADHLCQLKFISSAKAKDQAANRNSGNEALVRSVICAGLYPNVASVRIRRNKHKGAFPVMQTAQERKVDAHPKSVNSKESNFRHPWLVYHLKMKSTGTFIYDSSEVSPMSLIFFGRDFRIGEEILEDGTVLETIAVDDFVKFNCAAKTSVVFRELRRALDELLEFKASNPGVTDWNPEKREGAILDAIVNLLTCHAEGSSVEEDYDSDQY